jgi:hypothetical protein
MWTWGRVELERKVSHTLEKPWGILTWSLGSLIFKGIDPTRTQDKSCILFSLFHKLAPINIFFFDIATEILSESSTYVVEWTWWFMGSSRRFLVMHTIWKRVAAWLLMNVPLVKNTVLEVYDDQVIIQAIKAFCVGQLHNHLAREHLKTVQELYENFEKFNKLEVLHFRNLEQKSKAPKEIEASRPARYNQGRENRNNYCNIPNVNPVISTLIIDVKQ